jgi:uncharacterized membrane protein YphA (DoxX/SURF4 family)
MHWPYKLCRWTLSIIFIYAGGAKLLKPEIFAILIDAYGFLPERLLIPVAIGLPLLELIAGIGLLFDIRGSLALITGSLVLFMAVLGYGIWMGLDVDCGCFGLKDPEAEAFHGLRLSLLRDLAMMTGVLFIYGWRRYHSIQPKGVFSSVNHLLK